MRRPVLAVGVALALVVAGGATAVALAGASGGSAPAQVVATASGSPSAEPVGASDFCFVEAMIFYRVEADELATVVLAADGISAETRDAAAADAAHQREELDALRAWYVEWAPARPLEPTDDGACSGHGDHAAMPGIPSRSQRGALSSADGPEAEDLYLALRAGVDAGIHDLAAQTLAAPGHPLVHAEAEAAAAEVAARRA
ncbi:DUF305 domain-containing protein [Microbacterium hominis]|uniref:DUF305 domain-containing protein n=1 Tax=Microbacterium hominis TaxID=162426 RepID=A0A7D4QBN4_9MICO|nr:DUF305 domain-containing protein [Microbacterium hominis]QKJ18677.1 DUF305 domain-containing protein [Microbacterium hominis]